MFIRRDGWISNLLLCSFFPSSLTRLEDVKDVAHFSDSTCPLAHARSWNGRKSHRLKRRPGSSSDISSLFCLVCPRFHANSQGPFHPRSQVLSLALEKEPGDACVPVTSRLLGDASSHLLESWVRVKELSLYGKELLLTARWNLGWVSRHVINLFSQCCESFCLWVVSGVWRLSVCNGDTKNSTARPSIDFLKVWRPSFSN